MKIKYLFIIITAALSFAIYTLHITADPVFKWPVNLPKRLSATLGETRGSYLHQGIDIKTNGRPGYPVFASAGGNISRIISKENGYGNALFLDHGSNMQTVYGHLDSFEEARHRLDTLTKTIMLLNNSDYLDFMFYNKKLFFEKDEKIATTGETGSGFPHLHFEIRQNDKYVNPMDYIHIRDTAAPVIECIYLCNEKENATVYEKRIDVKKRHGSYTAKNPVEFGGEKVFFKISCYDYVGAYNRVAVYRIKVYMNKKMIFETAFDNLTETDVYLGSHVYDRSKSTIRGGTSFIYYLCKKEGSRLSTFKSADDGYINLDSDKNIKITVSDFAGNETALDFRIEKKDPVNIHTDDYIKISSEKNYKVASAKKDIRISIPENAVSLSTIIKIEEETDPGIISKICETYSINKDDVLKTFAVIPHDTNYHRPLTISIKPDSRITDEDKNNILMFQLFEGKKPRVMKTKTGEYYTAETFSNGYYALIRDKTPPKITLPPTFRFAEDRGIYRKIRLYASDDLSKIDKESIECLIDGESFQSTYDSDREWIEVSLPRDILLNGIHHIFARARDNAGNSAIFRNIIVFN